VSDLLPGSTLHSVAVAGTRFALHRAGPTAGQPALEQPAGTPALLLHGVPQTAVMWRALVPELARTRLVLAPDLKGLGGSEVRGPYDVPTLTRELAALVEHEVEGPVDLVGHDWGGVLALSLAGTRPELVRRLVVLNAPYRSVSVLHAPHLPAFALPVLPEVAFRLGGRGLVRRMIAAGWKSSTVLEPEVLEHYCDAYTDQARVRAMLGYYRAAVRPRVRAGVVRAARKVGVGSGGYRTAAPPPPVSADEHLVVWGAADPVLPVSVGESVVRDLGARTAMVTLPGVGHFVLEEAPELVVPVVTEFLDRVKPAEAA